MGTSAGVCSFPAGTHGFPLFSYFPLPKEKASSFRFRFMGNTSSSGGRTISQEVGEGKPAAAKSSSSSTLLPSSARSGATTEAAITKESRNQRQIRRSVSLDGVFGRLNESFRKISSTLSCTALSGSTVRRHPTGRSRSRPWSRVSRRRWRESTLADELLLSKTCWPVTHAEALFLPHFPIDCLAERKYELVQHIANGAFGKVYKVRATKASEGKSQEDYALKVLSKSEIIDSSAIRQLKDEVDIQTICGHHPFLARCIRYWQNKKKVFLLSPFYSNGELFQKNRTFTNELVRLYVAEIALALDFLHQAGIIYRDLKPENVLLDQDYHVRLIDFGLSKWLSIGSRTRTLCGTLQYMGKALF